MEKQPEFEFDRYFNDYFNVILNRNAEDNRTQYIQTIDLAQSELENLSIEYVIAKAINKFEVEEMTENSVVRSDAKLFLLINYRTMVYFPLRNSSKFTERGLKRKIFSEVQQILREANQYSTEITAHKVLQAGSEIWNSLGTLSGDSW
ncbi:hypothetical protein [Flavobacterium ardleyense]|uniref:hypothetical protein n=1 Tax=Flavobacterium ardleyense TaxID=2038737 RepID=UPI00298CA179|nr:hypothetical protein [Flavobacterium ardleyense]